MSRLWTIAETIGTIPAGVWVFIGGLVSVAVGNVFTKWLARQKEARDDRKDYREEIKELWDKVNSLETQVTLWRDRYYAEQEVSASLRVRLIRHGIDPASALPAPPPSVSDTPPPAGD